MCERGAYYWPRICVNTKINLLIQMAKLAQHVVFSEQCADRLSSCRPFSRLRASDPGGKVAKRLPQGQLRGARTVQAH